MTTLSRKLTLSAAEGTPSGTIRWDGQVKGFGAKGNRNGTVTFVVKTRVKGRQRWITIGKLGSPWTVETARSEALRVLAEAAAGRDVVEAENKLRGERTPFEMAATQFLAEHGVKLKPSTLRTYTALTEQRLIPAFAGRAIAEISRGDVTRLHVKLADQPRTANYTLAVLSKMMTWAEDQGLRKENTNPCRRTKKFKEVKRERYLSPDELARLGAVLDAASRDGESNPNVIAAIRLLLLTGARLSEILTLQWTFVDAHRRLLMLPDSKTGAKVIPLNQAALEVLASLPRLRGNPYVFVSHVEGRHFVGLQKPWQKLRAAAGLDDVRLHDLRHSFASMGVSAGGSLPVIGRLLGHTQAQTTARYAHVADAAAAALVEATGARIAAAMGLPSPAPAQG
ncbi:MAG: tyrosine-type recombinase/integrase [Hyphomicrobiales bacterium]|nr:tyrosine-type recombinase/integrase [Hyphomicrobiales bacterium]